MCPPPRTATDRSGRARAERGEPGPPAPPPLETYFEGGGILDEIAGPLRLVLWQRFRDVQLWTSTSPAKRTNLYRESHNADAIPAFMRRTRTHRDLAHPLLTLEAVCTDPETIGADVVVSACLQISEWASGKRFLTTAIQFAEAAYFLRPDDPDLAVNAGRACRQRAEHARAKMWFWRAKHLARGTEEWTSYVDESLGLRKRDFSGIKAEADPVRLEQLLAEQQALEELL